MQLEVGAIVEGKVTGITKFGAFVELPTGKTGMVHISEVSSSYVKEISDHLSENQTVKVKVLSISPEGKVSLSIRKCQDASQQPEQPRPRPAAPRQQQGSGSPQPRRSYRDQGWRGPKQAASADGMSFEDMMAKFKQTSDDKMSDLKRSTEFRKGSSKRGTK